MNVLARNYLSTIKNKFQKFVRIKKILVKAKVQAISVSKNFQKQWVNKHLMIKGNFVVSWEDRTRHLLLRTRYKTVKKFEYS